MRVAVIGANGQLGQDVIAAFAQKGDEVYSLTHADIELSNCESVRFSMTRVQPHIVVNAAAMHHVENCEREPEKAFAVNGMGARNLAQAAHEIGAAVMHVSTDYVFDGAKGKPYEETDAPRPLNVYGNTKLSGEYFVRATTDKHFVLRTSAIYGKHPCRAKGGLNFVELMLKLARERGTVRVVDSEFVSPTSTKEIARQILVLSRTNCYGLYHATAEGSCSWYEFAREIFELAKLNVKLDVASPDEFPTKAPRPFYSVLENCVLKRRGLNVFRPWQEGLRAYLSAREYTSP
ncbi:MAG TPA: dTDP-4-dehydrorhamnose reductase [Candidatus Acidoferrales bacterium]|nr:dTDP-4-dehydrorhamnose reductase [Candidatus Acidoferrales bacterium]